MPSLSPDGKDVYFIREGTGKAKHQGGSSRYTWFDLQTPEIAKVPVDGSAKPVQIISGKIKNGRDTSFFWMREPVLGPDGHSIAVASDGPDPREKRRHDPGLRHRDEGVHDARSSPSRGWATRTRPGPRTAAISRSSRTPEPERAGCPRS